MGSNCLRGDSGKVIVDEKGIEDSYTVDGKADEQREWMGS